MSAQTHSKVYLVGAGPGDPGLITVKGRECIARADVVIYDYLAAPSLLAFARPDAELVYVGKKGGDHTLPQDDINQLIVKKAVNGNIVTRLKGGDPFIFGRGGEEAEVLIEAGIPFEIVPGVTSAIAAPAYAGIPLTHRKFTSTVAFVTGHESPEKTESSIDWASLAKGIGTLVFLMGVKNLPHIAAKLMEHGRRPETPVALVRWGTTSKQATVAGTLETIVERVKAAGLQPPCIIVVGEVVGLRDRMMWFEKAPLFGKTIVVTRARAQASELVQRLADLGAECVEFPTIEIFPIENNEPLDAALNRIASYDWVIFTSVNSVDLFFKRLFQSGRDARALGHIRTACIGPATAERLRTFGLTCDVLPETYVAESVVAAFAGIPVKGKRFLLPRAAEARPVIPAEIGRMGGLVDEIAVYETRPASGEREILLERLNEGGIDMITFTSSSTVRNFRQMIPDDRFASLMKGVAIASIGPVTTETARELGFEVHVTAGEHTIPGLCDAVRMFYAGAM